MTPQENERLSQIHQSQQRIERWLLGDRDGGQRGLIEKHERLHSRVTRLELIAVYLAAICVIAGVLYKVVTDWWPRT